MHDNPDDHGVVTPLLDDCLHTLLKILTSHPDGISEYDLLRRLEMQDDAMVDEAFLDDLALFRAHFLLFNALYRLRDRLAAAHAYWLEIHALRIVLRPWSKSPAVDTQALVLADPLRAYYLDTEELARIGAEQVAELLGSFWRRYLALEGRAAALAELGLKDPVSGCAIQQRYRELAMQHHPDRGGDAAAFRRLVSARQLLQGSN